MDALAFAEQLIELSMVGSLVNRSSQMHHPAHGRFGDSVDRLVSPEAVGQGCGSTLPVSRQHAPGMAQGNAHELSRLVQGDVLCE